MVYTPCIEMPSGNTCDSCLTILNYKGKNRILCGAQQIFIEPIPWPTFVAWLFQNRKGGWLQSAVYSIRPALGQLTFAAVHKVDGGLEEIAVSVITSSPSPCFWGVFWYASLLDYIYPRVILFLLLGSAWKGRFAACLVEGSLPTCQRREVDPGWCWLADLLLSQEVGEALDVQSVRLE